MPPSTFHTRVHMHTQNTQHLYDSLQFTQVLLRFDDGHYTFASLSVTCLLCSVGYEWETEPLYWVDDNATGAAKRQKPYTSWMDDYYPNHDRGKTFQSFVVH